MLEREEAVELAKSIREHYTDLPEDRDPTELEGDIVALCYHVINRGPEFSYVLRAQADRLYTLAEEIKEIGDQPSPGGSTHSAVRKMSSLGYELAEMILSVEPDFKIDGPYYDRTDSLQFDEMQLIEPGDDEAQIVANLKRNIDHVLGRVLASLEQPVMVKQAMTSVMLDHNHIQWKPGVVVERVVNWDDDHKPTSSFIRVAASFHVEGYRVEGLGEDQQRLVKIDG